MEIKTRFNVNQPVTCSYNKLECLIYKIETYSTEDIRTYGYETSVFYYYRTCDECDELGEFCSADYEDHLIAVKTDKPKSDDIITYELDGFIVYRHKNNIAMKINKSTWKIYIGQYKVERTTSFNKMINKLIGA